MEKEWNKVTQLAKNEKVIQIEMNEDDEIMVSAIDSALEYLDKEYKFFSNPITVQNMRDWLKEKLPSKFV